MDSVLVVDDEHIIRKLLIRILSSQGYEVTEAASVDEAISALNAQPVSLVMSDMNMPGRSGLELVQHMREHHEDTAVVMVTGVDDRPIAETALRLGVYGYIIKPFETNEVLINVTNALRRRALEMENRKYRNYLERLVNERTTELRAAVADLERSESELRTSQEETIQRLARAAEFRSDETALHIQRMSLYCEQLALRAGLGAERAAMIRIASPMHDIGKIATPDHILMKAGRLTADEFEVMKQHAEIGYRILADSDSEMLQLAAEIAFTHHEKWDGSGYPRGLKGDEIPLEGRICAIADVFDALTSARCYKPEFSLERSREIMMEGRGAHFDPELLDMFWSDLTAVLEIKAQYPDRT